MRVSPIFRIIQPNDDFLLRDVEPFVGDPLGAGLGSKLLKVGNWDEGRRTGPIALQHHVQQRLEMHSLVLKANPNGSPNVPRDRVDATLIVALKPGTHAALIGLDLGDGRPLIWNL